MGFGTIHIAQHGSNRGQSEFIHDSIVQSASGPHSVCRSWAVEPQFQLTDGSKSFEPPFFLRWFRRAVQRRQAVAVESRHSPGAIFQLQAASIVITFFPCDHATKIC